MASKYIQTVDFTSRAQEERQRERGASGFQEPDPPLPEATPETLPDIVQQAFRAAGWTELTPVQEKAIPYLLDERDMIVQARTGTGKTGAFLLPLFELLDPALREQQVLILAPTRELARQIHEEFDRMKLGTAETNELDAVLIYGGVGYGPQIKALKDGAQVVIGTPGRVLDHLQSRNFSLKHLKLFILDEADEMLSMGFYPAMQDLKKHLPEKRRSYMFSATMPPKVISLGREFLTEPSFLSLSSGQMSVDEIDHRYYLVGKMDKDRALIRLMEMENPDSALIFCNTKREVSYLATLLKNYGFDADEISGDLSQKDREKAMAKIREGNLRFLVATDVAARGIDITDLSHVFMYDLPQDREYFIHRSGRTARAGKSGVSIALVTHEDAYQLERTAKRYGVEVERHDLPTDEDVSARVGERLTEVLEGRLRAANNIERERAERLVPLVRSLAKDEPELLGMLVDEVYRAYVRRVPEQPSAEPETTEPEEKAEATNGAPASADERRSERRPGNRRQKGRR